jgi:hypothetical protein
LGETTDWRSEVLIQMVEAVKRDAGGWKMASGGPIITARTANFMLGSRPFANWGGHLSFAGNDRPTDVAGRTLLIISDLDLLTPD